MNKTQNLQKEKGKYTNLDFIRQMTKGDSKMIMEMVNVYLEETPKYINKIKQGISTMDWESIARASHSFLPSFATMGMDEEYTDMAKKINQYVEKKENFEKIKELLLKIEELFFQASEELEKELVILEKN